MGCPFQSKSSEGPYEKFSSFQYERREVVTSIAPQNKQDISFLHQTARLQMMAMTAIYSPRLGFNGDNLTWASPLSCFVPLVVMHFTINSMRWSPALQLSFNPTGHHPRGHTLCLNVFGRTNQHEYKTKAINI